MKTDPKRQSIRPGMTLVELMIVIAILVMLMAVAVPMLAPVLKSQRIRESARILNSQLMSAQGQAVARGRSCGVWIQPSENNPAMALDIFMAEVPLPYSGDSESARATITGSGQATLNGASMITQLKIGQGDLIRFNYQGAYYKIQSASGESVTFGHQSAPNPPQTNFGMPFQIFRKPVQAYGRPTSMPGLTCVDLGKSGIGPNGSFAGATGPVVIMFAPTGKLESVYYNGQRQDGLGAAENGSVFLLVGETKLMVEDGTCMENGDSRWVTINRQTGISFVSENDVAGTGLAGKRTFARSGSAMQGN